MYWNVHELWKSEICVRVRLDVDRSSLTRHRLDELCGTDTSHYVYLRWYGETIRLSDSEDNVELSVETEFNLPESLSGFNYFKAKHEDGQLMATTFSTDVGAEVSGLGHATLVQGSVSNSNYHKLSSLARASHVEIYTARNDGILSQLDKLKRVLTTHNHRGEFTAKYQLANDKSNSQRRTNPPQFAVPPRHTFHSWPDYARTMCAAMQREADFRNETMEEYSATPADKKHGAHTYTRGWLFVKSNFDTDNYSDPIKLGDVVTIWDNSEGTKGYKQQPLQAIAVTIPYSLSNYETCLYFTLDNDTYLSNAILGRPQNTSFFELEECRTHEAFVKPESNDNNERCVFKSFTKMAEDQNAEDLRRILIGRDFHSSGMVDLFKGLSDQEANRVEKMMIGRPDQVAAFEMTRRLTNRLAFIYGPPGTGKTEIAAILGVANKMANKNSTGPSTAYFTGSNYAANVLVKRANDRGCKTLRLQCISLVINRLGQQLKLICRPSSEGSTAVPDMFQRKLSILAKSLDQEADRLNVALYSDQDDSQEDTEMISGFKKEADIILTDHRISPDVKFYTVESQAMLLIKNPEWKNLLDLARMAASNWSGLNKEKAKKKASEFDSSLKKLVYTVIKSSEAIVATTIVSNDLKKLDWLKPSLVVVDDACQMKEPESVMVLTNNSQAKGFVFIGDPKQLQAKVMSCPRHIEDPENQRQAEVPTQEDNPMILEGSIPPNELYLQLKLPLMTRLMELGYPSVSMHIQSRAVSDIADLWSELSYGGDIVHGKNTSVNTRLHAMSFRRFVKDEFGISDANAIAVDIADSSFRVARRTKSGVNPDFRLRTNQLIEKMSGYGIHPTSCMIVTPYNGQRLAHHAENQRFAVTIDATQGAEYDIVIVDLVAAGKGNRPYPFVQNACRLNAAISRPRDGLIVIGDKRTMADSARYQPGDVNYVYAGIFKILESRGYMVREEVEKGRYIEGGRDTVEAIGLSDEFPKCTKCGERGHRLARCPRE
ncbi:uncharacterized protein K452DRAFT_313001 [Aplosporella prunicola CBS 121167]|uniref:CCHC-type domain-containing protein n=1 Tax=Aplosporella prunicola CBS 121167 TaxID=1176127 RepID=A0A6A6AXX4_9PEZI|nr:uncharacterized protein K452DRAFT_313001 [Aplosporella prunicola CBS 121167]KAF2136630.1 hypothetical protein K452DRAFT_313001 [Aplosporella prunicola CBS 121167]